MRAEIFRFGDNARPRLRSGVEIKFKRRDARLAFGFGSDPVPGIVRSWPDVRDRRRRIVLRKEEHSNRSFPLAGQIMANDL